MKERREPIIGQRLLPGVLNPRFALAQEGANRARLAGRKPPQEPLHAELGHDLVGLVGGIDPVAAEIGVERAVLGVDRPGVPEMAFVEAALIIESGFDKKLDRTVVCWCREEQQLGRLEERGLSAEEARQRVASQMPMEEKRSHADDVIDCSGATETTERETVDLVGKLRQLAAAGGNNS